MASIEVPAVIRLIEPSQLGNERDYVTQCIDSGYVSSVGPFVDRFEQEFARTIGVEHAVACASGTAALHVALRIAGARPGSLVAVSDLTFVASANAISYTGSDILLVDSETATWNMNTELLHDHVVQQAAQGQRIPDIVEVVHLLGHPADIEPLLELRQRFGIKIVEDAAEALGARWLAGPGSGRQAGAAGDIGCYSFNGNKIITTGGGGMIATEDPHLAQTAKHLTTQAKVPGSGYNHDTVGYNYRMNALAAAFGVAQLEKLAETVRAKRSVAAHYDCLLEGASAIHAAPVQNWAYATHWLYSVFFGDLSVDLDGVVQSLLGVGIETRRIWPPLHRQRPYSKTPRLAGDVAEDIYRRVLSLPSSPHLTGTDQERVVMHLERYIETNRLE